MDISIPIPASSIRFPTVTTAAAVPAVAVAAVETADPVLAPVAIPVSGKESMMREMLLKKRQGGAIGGKQRIHYYASIDL